MAVVNEMFDGRPTKITGWPLSGFSGVYVSVCDVHAAKWQPLQVRSRDASLLNARFLAPSIIGEERRKNRRSYSADDLNYGQHGYGKIEQRRLQVSERRRRRR